MVEGRRNFGPAPKHKPEQARNEARNSAAQSAQERISATRGGSPHERGGERDLQRGFEMEHDGTTKGARCVGRIASVKESAPSYSLDKLQPAGTLHPTP